jgi:hypothetical protein
VDGETPSLRGDFLAEQCAVGIAVLPALAAGLLLSFVVAAHTLGSRLQGFSLGGGDGFKRGLEFFASEFKLCEGGGLHAVKTLGVFEHRCVAALLHISQDVGHTLLDGAVGVGAPVQAGFELGFKVGLCGGQAQRLGGESAHAFKLKFTRFRRWLWQKHQ